MKKNSRIRIGITGQSGFIGSRLSQKLADLPERFKIIPFRSSFFSDAAALSDFVGRCDTVVHLACLNRHEDPEFLYRTNIELTQKLILALNERPEKQRAVVYASSIREYENGLYGKAKLHSRLLLEEWAAGSQSPFAGLVIPNTFGPGAKPFHNSFIATFCRQLILGQTPVVTENREVPLLHIDTLCKSAIRRISSRFSGISRHKIRPDFRMNVSDALGHLKRFHEMYQTHGQIPLSGEPALDLLRETFLSHLS